MVASHKFLTTVCPHDVHRIILSRLSGIHRVAQQSATLERAHDSLLDSRDNFRNLRIARCPHLGEDGGSSIRPEIVTLRRSSSHEQVPRIWFLVRTLVSIPIQMRLGGSEPAAGTASHCCETLSISGRKFRDRSVVNEVIRLTGAFPDATER